MNLEYEIQVGQAIRRIRKQQNMTQEQLAAQLQTRGCDVTRSALAKIEVGQRHIYVDELKCLSEILKITVDELLSE